MSENIYSEHGVFVIVPTISVTEEMINVCKKHFNVIGNASSNSLRKSALDDKTLLRFKDLESGVFDSYQWYTHDEIIIELEEEEWQ